MTDSSSHSVRVIAPVPIRASPLSGEGGSVDTGATVKTGVEERKQARGMRVCMLLFLAVIVGAVLSLRFSSVFAWFRCGSADGCYNGRASAQAVNMGPVPSVRYNYASASCGAKVVWKKSLHRPSGVQLISHASAVLDESSEKYLYAACDHCGAKHTIGDQGCFWFVVELCQAIKVDAISLQTKELFAAYPKEFSIEGSFSFVPYEYVFNCASSWFFICCLCIPTVLLQMQFGLRLGTTLLICCRIFSSSSVYLCGADILGFTSCLGGAQKITVLLLKLVCMVTLLWRILYLGILVCISFYYCCYLLVLSYCLMDVNR